MKNFKNIKDKIAFALLFLLPSLGFSQEEIAQNSNTVFSNALFNTLLGAIIFLLIIIVALTSVIKNISVSEFIKPKPDNQNKGTTTLLIIGFTLLGLSSYAEGNSSPINNWLIGGLTYGTFFFMSAIILIEIIFIMSLIGIIKKLIKNNVTNVATESAVVKPKEKTIFDKLNDAIEIENESEIMLDHNYDGIKELDNNLPPWWKYGFYLTIVFAVIYLVHYHISGTGKLQAAEYTEEIKQAETDIAEFMKNSANNVDESSVKLLTDAGELASGKDVFIANCAACHGRLGEGGVGPNLTDDYWIHGGSVKDVFKTIKYGWPDKGMKAWKEDLSPVQISQITSFIKSIRGTNPPKAKEKQGELYTESAVAATDSTTVKADSLNLMIKVDSLKK